jgi:curved DNA-binding protein CbpA
MNAYELLESKETDDIEKIKSNYHRLLLAYHPDKNSNSTENIDLFIK